MIVNQNELINTIKKLGVAPLKQHGQHFLIDQKVVTELVRSADLSQNDDVLEVGPGLGTLTEKLVQKAKRLVACEIDKKLFLFLKKSFSSQKNLTLLHGDIRKINLADYFPNSNYVVVSNIPYSLTSYLLKMFLASPAPPRKMALLVQKEIAERITARPPDMSLLSLSVQLFCEPKIVRVIPPTAFYPEPEVSSAILILVARSNPLIKKVEQEIFFRLAKISFAGKRKQIHNSLKNGLRLSSNQISQLLKNSAIDESRRPQTLTWSEWQNLTTNYSKLS